MPGMKMNDRQMKQAMKKMGIKQNTVDGVTEVIIRTRDKEIIVRNAEVICVEMGGNRSYQISGAEEERILGFGSECTSAVFFPQEDVELVMSQTGCDMQKAVAALDAADGQPAEAIIKIISE